jgi:nucleotide-binding universal stress UspA family protein
LYRKILVPYDISNPADRALAHAVKLAKATDESTQVVILHVIPDIPIYPVLEHAIKSKHEGQHTFNEHVQFVYESMKSYVTKILEDKKSEYRQAGVTIKTDVVQGKPVDKIINYAKDADLIVMGSTGFSGISKLRALGSVSRGVLEKSECPVMIVH